MVGAAWASLIGAGNTNNKLSVIGSGTKGFEEFNSKVPEEVRPVFLLVFTSAACLGIPEIHVWGHCSCQVLVDFLCARQGNRPMHRALNNPVECYEEVSNCRPQAHNDCLLQGKWITQPLDYWLVFPRRNFGSFSRRILSKRGRVETETCWWS